MTPQERATTIAAAAAREESRRKEREARMTQDRAAEIALAEMKWDGALSFGDIFGKRHIAMIVRTVAAVIRPAAREEGRRTLWPLDWHAALDRAGERGRRAGIKEALQHAVAATDLAECVERIRSVEARYALADKEPT